MSQINETKQYIADIYLRLSNEDGDKEESDSIGNQRALILDFLKSMPDITINKIRIDDGYSGVDFNRPAFIEMMNDINVGIVNCVIVKDFSRFGRNYIEAGKYIQVIFPRTGIRFIAVNDAYDSTKVQGYMNNIIVPFKNMVNDAYCADISMKIRSAFGAKMKKGDFIGSFAVYGYIKDPNNKNKLIVDDFAAEVVRDIFKWKLEGLNADSIADKLNKAGVLTPTDYKQSIGLNCKSHFKVHKTSKWFAGGVLRVLKNAVYTGVLEQGKTTKPNYKVRESVDVPKEKWIRHENAHEAIIECEIFDTVQRLLKQDTRAVKKGTAVYPLSGVIVCGDCGSPMARKTNTKNGKKYPYYVCSRHRADISVCTTHIISFTACEEAVLNALRCHTAAVLDIEKEYSYADTSVYVQSNVNKLTARLEAKQDEIKKYEDFRLSLYENFKEGVINKDDFNNFKASYDVKIAESQTSEKLLREEIAQFKSSQPAESNQNWIERFKAVCNAETLERRIVAELIDSVKVFEKNRIEIVFRYQNEFERLLNAVQGVA
jgi:DNA invertase Pin-like site-specific DNA recombinase